MALSPKIQPVPLVSACLLTYRRAPVLERTIRDILNQDFTDFELVINDDCSPDETPEIARRAEARDPRVRYCRNERNLRYAGNQNAAVARSRGKYVAFLHDGDRYRPDLLRRWVEAMEKHPTAGLVFNALENLDPKGQVARTVEQPYPPLISGKKLYAEMLVRPDCPIFGIVMVRKIVLDQVGPFREEFPILGDIDMWFRILRHHDACYVREPLFAVYPREADHPNNRINWQVMSEHIRIHLAACDAFLPRGSGEWRKARIKILKMFRPGTFRWMLTCILTGRWDRFIEGFRLVLETRRWFREDVPFHPPAPAK